MDAKKSKAGPLELPPGVAAGPSNGPKGDVDASNRSLKTGVSSLDNMQESIGRVSHHVRSFSYERNKVANVPMGITKEGSKGGGNIEAQGQGSINQNGGLYIGGGKMVGPNGSPYGTMNTSTAANGKADKVESSPPVVHVRSNSAGSIKTGRSLGNAHWASGTGSAFEGPSNTGGRSGGGPKGDNAAETLSNSGSSNGGSPSQDLGKGLKVTHAESGSGGNTVRGLGNIGGRSGATNAKSPSSGQQATGRGSIPTPRNSGEFSIPNSGNGVNRGNSTPRHSGEFNGSGTGAGSSSSTSSPHTSGELGGAKANLTSFSKSSPDSGNTNSTSGQLRPAPIEGNIPGGRVNLGLNAGKGTKPNMPSSPPRVSSARSTPSLGNLRKANWIAGHTKSSEKLDCAMGNILNPGHVPPSANGNILSSGCANNGKASGKSETMKSGVAGARLSNADAMNNTTLVKRGFSSCTAEEVKNMGNELYRKGNFIDALSLYERAIALSPAQASYRSNKAAALSGLGHLPEAVHECEEAIKLDSLYVRAHQRAGSLYLRLGLVESSKRHFQSAGQQTSIQELQQVEQVKMQISRCIEMRKVANWKLVIRESDAAVVAGADSAPQVMGYKAEALLKLRKLDEADTVLSAAQKIDEALTKLGITLVDSFLYVLRAHLDMALGRFEEAVAAAQSAVRVDPRKSEALEILRKARAVCLARSSGNELFKLGKFFEACAAYGEGLESDPSNAVLLCNRAACRSKIGQWEKAVEDCNAALEVQPNYTKALLRRADCNLKLERWDDALDDYEGLLKELPGDRDVARGIFEAQSALKRSKGEMYKKKLGGDVEEVSDKDHFREAVTFPGLVVVQFIARWNDRCREILPFTEVLCKRYPAVNFIKVDVEENPYLAKTESVNSVPTFKLYKNGTKMKEMLGPSQQALENAVQQFSL
ncbi:hypothetical protein GOP47_0028927 [Adiantum capillus-veneris]|nr:hypothetical protein GOP47_0028927 [Adiantum capillus-veneris]